MQNSRMLSGHALSTATQRLTEAFKNFIKKINSDSLGQG